MLRVEPICLSFLIISLPLPLFAAGWVADDTSLSEDLHSVDFADGVGYAVGDAGTAWYLPEDTEEWEEGIVPTGRDLFAVAALSDTNAIAVGEAGAILLTENSGAAWSVQDSDTNEDLYDVRMSSSTVGYAVGASGTVLKTSDGGETWSELSSGVSSDLFSVGVRSSTVYASGEGGAMVKSTNSGSSWTSLSSGVDVDLTALEILGSSTVWIGGDSGIVIATSDSGSTWDEVSVTYLDEDEDVTAIDFLDGSDALVAATGGLYETTDTGESWTKPSVPGSATILDVTYEDDNDRWLSGTDGMLWFYDAGEPTKPTNLALIDGTPTNDSTPTLSWTASSDEESGIDHYELSVDDDDSYEDIGPFTSYTFDDVDPGSYKVYVRAVDEAGNIGDAASTSFTINASESPVVGVVFPRTAVTDEEVMFSATVTDDEEIDTCWLFVDDEEVETMSVYRTRAVATYTFSDGGSYEVSVACEDEEGNSTSGTAVTVTVSDAPDGVQPGDLVKLTCEGDVYVNDPCTAVYYFGPDGKRHAFPNERVFQTWYDDFDDLVELSDEVMASIALGQNVTYRPGVRLLKFETTIAVYAVERGGILRPIVSAEIAEDLYGDDWVSEIDTVSDVFYGNYEIGDLLEDADDYRASSEKSTASEIFKNW